jgi:helix-turn-helix protein
LQKALANPPPPAHKRKTIVLDALRNDEIDELENNYKASERDKQTLREFDRDVRITSFLYHSNTFHAAIIWKHFGSDLEDTKSVFTQARTKFFDNIKTQKNQMLKNLKKNLGEIREKYSTIWDLDDDAFRVKVSEMLNGSTFEHTV